jgi:hypothetical protein
MLPLAMFVLGMTVTCLVLSLVMLWHQAREEVQAGQEVPVSIPEPKFSIESLLDDMKDYLQGIEPAVAPSGDGTLLFDTADDAMNYAASHFDEFAPPPGSSQPGASRVVFAACANDSGGCRVNFWSGG